MRKTATKQFAILLSVAAIGAAQLTTVALGDVFTEPVGFYKVDLLTNSDTYTSVPFTRMPEFHGTVSSIAGNVITVNGNPNWTLNQWATPTANGFYPYYVRLENGSKAGAFYTITNNPVGNTLRVVLAPENLSGVGSPDRVRIIPYWTLGTVFPGGTGVVATTIVTVKKTELLFPNLAGVGINLAPGAQYFFYNSAWRRSAPSSPVTTNWNDVVILPDQYIVGRQSGGAPTSTYTAPGLVMVNASRIPLYANASPGPKQDNFLSIYRPAVQTFNQSALVSVIFTTTIVTVKRDEVLFFNNAVQAKNKAPSAQYFFYNNGWRRSAPSAPVTVDYGNSNVFNPGEGFIVRRATNTTTTAIWSNLPNY